MKNIDIPNIDWSSRDVWATLAVVLIFILIRYIAVKTVSRWTFQDVATKNKWVIMTKSLSMLILVLGLIFIWGSELRSLALSLMAVAAALVLATKELILCLMGGIMKVSTKLFRKGDRISIKDFRGEVIDHSFLVTTLFEMGPSIYSNQFTGRYIKVPNSLFLTNSLVITPAENKYVLHIFSIIVPLNKNLKQIETHLLNCANQVCENYFLKADKHIRKLCAKEGIETPTIEPRVTYYTKDKENLEFNIRMPIEINATNRIEKKLKDLFFDRYFEIKDEN